MNDQIQVDEDGYLETPTYISDRHDEIKCPYCDRDQDIEDQSFAWEDGRTEVECDSCEKEFLIEVSVSYMYESFEKVEEKTDENENTK